MTLTLVVLLLRQAGNYCMRRYESSHVDEWRQVALAIYYTETQVRIAQAREESRK